MNFWDNSFYKPNNIDQDLNDQLLNFQKKTFSDFNIFDYVDQEKFMSYDPKHQYVLSNFLKSAIELRKYTNKFYGRCLICMGSTKNSICRYCVKDMKL